MRLQRFVLSSFLVVAGCAHTENASAPEAPAAAASPASTAAAPHVLFSQIQGRAVAIKLVDRRNPPTNSSLLIPRTQSLLTSMLKDAGVQVQNDAADELVVMLDTFQEQDQGTMTQECAKFTGRFLKKGQEFLPNDVSQERCIIEGQPLTLDSESAPLTQAFIRGAADLPGVAKKPNLGRAYGIALSELMQRLDRQAR